MNNWNKCTFGKFSRDGYTFEYKVYAGLVMNKGSHCSGHDNFNQLNRAMAREWLDDALCILKEADLSANQEAILRNCIAALEKVACRRQAAITIEGSANDLIFFLDREYKIGYREHDQILPSGVRFLGLWSYRLQSLIPNYNWEDNEGYRNEMVRLVKERNSDDTD